ncbi:MAG: ferritin family protein [Acidobacteria bacterium]|nr:ferritin family protein [Acidobacteriota bacterium]
MSADHSGAMRATLLRAIQIEARNGGLYDSLSQLFEGYDDSIIAIFREMAAEERQHGAELERRYRERFGSIPPAASEPKEVIEAPDLEDAETFVFDSMTIEKALEAGLHAEVSARTFYRREAVRTSDPELQQAYRELAEFEDTHVRQLQKKLAEKQRPIDSASR